MSTTTPDPSLAGLVVMLLGLAGWALRNWTPNTGWLHTAKGHIVIGIATGVLGAVADAIAEHGLSWRTAMMAAVSGISGAIGASNSSVRNRSFPPGWQASGDATPVAPIVGAGPTAAELEERAAGKRAE